MNLCVNFQFSAAKTLDHRISRRNWFLKADTDIKQLKTNKKYKNKFIRRINLINR